MSEKHKVCMLGASGVGKTSLVTRFVHRAFSDVYRTTIGVTIEKKQVRVCEREIGLVIWDLSGEDEFQNVNFSYMRGAGGLLAVVDGTRRATVEVAIRLRVTAREMGIDAPCVFVLNKSDLVARWELDSGAEAALRRAGGVIVRTSAKTGDGVEEAFATLARGMLLDPERPSWGP